jgi:Na+-driven multidrug efflux pump
VLFFMLFAHELLEVWVGVNIADEGSALLRILSLAYLLSCLTMVPHYVSLGVGRVKVIAFFNLLTLLATLIVVPVSSYLSGVIGLGVGMLVVALLGPVFILYVNRRVVSVGTRSYVRAVFHNHTSMAVCFLVAAGGLKVVATVPGYARWGVASPVLLIVYYMASIASNRYLYQKLKDYSRSILRPSSPAGRPA